MAYQPVQIKRATASQSKSDCLFSGIWIRWGTLTAAERLVCIVIILLPLWWALGIIPYLIFCLTVTVAAYEWYKYGKLRPLKPPTWAVKALIIYYFIDSIDIFLLYLDAHPLAVLPTTKVITRNDLVESILQILSFPFLVWYIQSHHVRVRLKVIAWALTISATQMLGVWLIIYFILGEPAYNPPLSAWGFLTGKKAEYSLAGPRIGKPNMLILYWPTAKAFGGVSRYYSFLHGPEPFGQFAAIIGIIALEVRNHIWSILLLISSIVLIGLSGTRNVWIAFPIILIIFCFSKTHRIGGTGLLLALMAAATFTVFSVPPITNEIQNIYLETKTYITEFREKSTEERSDIYEGTFEGIIDNPTNFILGNRVKKGHLGTHSFILGDLLYLRGLIGAGLFIVFLTALVRWLNSTGHQKPTSSFLIIVLLCLNFATMAQVPSSLWAILLSMMLKK